MFCNECEEDSGFDNASTGSGSGQSSCKCSVRSDCIEEECKCTELQNPIMQYYPAWPITTKSPVPHTNKSKHISSACPNGEAHNSNPSETEDTDYEEETGDEVTGNRTGDVAISALSKGLPKNIGSVQLSVILIGDSSTGKTSLVARFADDRLIENYETTIGIDFSIARFRLNGTSVRLQIWDTAGQEKFNAITTQYYHRAMGVVMVYDVTKQSSFDSILRWNRAVEQHADPDIVKLLCGNKMDLDEERKVSKEQGDKLARQIGARFCEVSALETTNVFEAFSLFSRDVFLEYYAKRNPCASPSAVRLNPVPASDNKTGCCS